MNKKKKEFEALRNSCRLLEIENNNKTIDLTKAQLDIKLLRLGSIDTMKALLLLNKKTQNLTEIVKFLPTNKDRKEVIAFTKDGKDITVGNVLDSEDLIPCLINKFEEEYQTAII